MVHRIILGLDPCVVVHACSARRCLVDIYAQSAWQEAAAACHVVIEAMCCARLIPGMRYAVMHVTALANQLD